MARAFPKGSEDEENESLGNENSKTKVLDYFGRDLTAEARAGKLDPVIGREEEIDKLVQILNKRKKNNPVIVGEAGIGKTALVEGLATRIVERKADRWLLNKRIIELNLSSLVGGTKYRGQFEERMKAIIDEAVQNDDVIIFIDELHNVIGAGGASGSMDAAQIIKPELARGAMRVIGATTLDEYKKSIANDSALERRFQRVTLAVPSAEETFQILQQIRGKYEDFHAVKYSDDILKYIIEITGRYVTNRNFPDKAIDLMDEVGSKAKLGFREAPKELQELEQKLVDIDNSKKNAVKQQNFEEAARYRDLERNTKNELQKVTEQWKKSLMNDKQDIEISDVASVISAQTGIPVSKLTDEESDRLLKMQTYLQERVIGQESAIEKICEAVQRSRVGIQDPNKPIASLLFLGSTGVGKTYLSKILAKYMFDREDSLIRFDMSEYSEKFQVTKLIGSPPGYTGHEEKGQLTEKIKNRPYSIVLFDEMEKAHEDIWNILLQILDEGKLTDNHGQEVNFKNTVIIMTSNIGTEAIVGKKQLGFTQASEAENVERIVMQALEKSMRPELINRIDEKIVFKPLEAKEIMKIVELELKKVVRRIESLGYQVHVSDAVKDFLSEVGYDSKYGARPLKRAIVKYIENVFTQAVLKETIQEGASVTFRYKEKDKLVYVQNQPKSNDAKASSK